MWFYMRKKKTEGEEKNITSLWNGWSYVSAITALAICPEFYFWLHIVEHANSVFPVFFYLDTEIQRYT